MTIAEQTYRAQQEVDFAASRLWDIDTSTLEGTRLHAQAQADLAAQREVTAALQAEAGGQVFDIVAEYREDIEAKIAKIARKAAKLDAEAPTLTWHEEYIAEERENGKVVRHYARQYVAVKGAAPKLAGYDFLATLQHEEAGTIVRKVPGTDDIDTAAYRAAAPDCAHCKVDRRRKRSYLVRHDGGEILQVGSTCIADFLGGVSPARVVQGFGWFADLEGALTEAGEGCGSAPSLISTGEFLTHVATMIRLNGWVSAGQARDDYSKTSTRQAADINLFNRKNRICSRQGEQLWEDPTAADIVTAQAALAYCRETYKPGDAALTDFESNLAISVAPDHLAPKSMGLAAFAIKAHHRAIEDEIKVERQAAVAATSEHVGQVGDRLSLTLTVEAVHEIEGHYGVTFITKLADADGNVWKWFGSRALERGATYTGKWTVKDHAEYKGVRETVITRPAKLAEVETAVAA